MKVSHFMIPVFILLLVSKVGIGQYGPPTYTVKVVFNEIQSNNPLKLDEIKVDKAKQEVKLRSGKISILIKNTSSTDRAQSSKMESAIIRKAINRILNPDTLIISYVGGSNNSSNIATSSTFEIEKVDKSYEPYRKEVFNFAFNHYFKREIFISL